VEDALQPLRIIAGTEDAEARDVIRTVYARLVDAGTPYIETDTRTAEVAKHACNAFLALKVSYVNALARVCELAGANVGTVTTAMAADERIGAAYLEAGLGFGGYCLPKDLRAFERAAAALGYDFGLLREVDRVNDEAVDAAFSMIEVALDGVRGRRVALLGLAFKPGTDNVIASPALALARRLAAAGATVSGYDPQAGANAKAEVAEVEVAGDPYAALEGAECAVLCTGWQELSALDPDRMREVMAEPVVVDGRNVLDGEALAKAGFRYLPMGRPAR
jgi:UDPglucose 6-dehydrogenase